VANPYEHYRKVATETADPLELVIMLYRGAINHLNAAEHAIATGQVQPAHRSLIRAQEIVAELMGTLNLDAGEVAVNLSRLYDYMQQRLMVANRAKDAREVAAVRAMLSELLATWDEIARTARAAMPVRREFASAIAVA
jgi:flagellar protein FliS